MIAPKNTSLAQVLAYRNPAVVHRFTELYDVTTSEAEDIFSAMLKWLWLNMQPSTPGLVISESILIIDEMWHNFILFTQDYMDFCEHYFGVYIHHGPVRVDDKQRMAREQARDPTGYAAERAATLREQCLHIYRELGEETLLEWYVQYPRRYDTAFFEQRRLARAMNWQPSKLLRDIHDQTTRHKAA